MKDDRRSRIRFQSASLGFPRKAPEAGIRKAA